MSKAVIRWDAGFTGYSGHFWWLLIPVQSWVCLWRARVMLGLAVPYWHTCKLKKYVATEQVSFAQSGCSEWWSQKKEAGDLGSKCQVRVGTNHFLQNGEDGNKHEVWNRGHWEDTKNNICLVIPSILRLFRQNLSILEATYRNQCRFICVWLF